MQLSLTESELLEIGFVEKIHIVEGAYPEDLPYERKCFEIPCINGVFRYNPWDENYRWYQDIVVGDAANSIDLDITTLPALYTVFQAFKVKFNLVLL